MASPNKEKTLLMYRICDLSNNSINWIKHLIFLSAILPVTPSETIIDPCHQLKRNKCKKLKAEKILLQLFVFLIDNHLFSMRKRKRMSSQYLRIPNCSLCKTHDLYFTTSVLFIPCEDRIPKKTNIPKHINIFICLEIYHAATIALYSIDFKVTSS